MISLWQIYAFAAALFAALVAIFAKLGFNVSDKIDSMLATTIRSIIMTLFLIVICFIFDKYKTFSNFDYKSFYYITISGIVGSLSWVFYFLALQKAPAKYIPTIGAIDKLSVVFLIIFSAVFLKNNLTLISVLGIILITFGTILMSL